MIKKILIGSVCLLSCVTLLGCTANQDAVTTNLAGQLDRLNNSVNSISQKGNYTLPSLSSLNKEGADSYSGAYNTATTSITNQDNTRDGIKSRVALIKNQLGNGLKLSKQNISSLRNLTTSLAGEINNLNSTKSEYNSAVRSVNKAMEGKDNEQISAKITRLSSCLDARTCYYNNILNTLAQIQSIIGIKDNNSTPSNSLNMLNGTNISNTSLTESDTSTFSEENLQNLLYQYLMNRLCPNGNCFPNGTTNNYCTDGNCYNNGTYCPNGECYPNTNNSTRPEINNFANPINNNSNNGYGYGTNNGINNGYNNGNGINNGYNNSSFNPNRNTDSYGPTSKNIDTYRNPINNENNNNSNNGYGTNNGNGVLNQNPTENNDSLENKNSLTDKKDVDTADIKNDTLNNISGVEINKDVEKTDNNKTTTTPVKSSLTIDRKDEQSKQPVVKKPVQVENPIVKKPVEDSSKTTTTTAPAKGRTNTVACLDVNKKIDDLVRGNLTETFENQFIKLG